MATGFAVIMTSYLLVMSFFINKTKACSLEIETLQQRWNKWEPQGGLCRKINLIWTHPMQVDWSSYEPFNRASYSLPVMGKWLLCIMELILKL